MGVARSKYHSDPMGESRFHKIIVLTAAMQNIPSPLIMVLMVMLAGIVALLHPDDSNIPLLYLGFSALNWLLLWLLPRFRLSYGPEKASALALALVMLGWTLFLILLNTPDWFIVAGFVLITLIAFYSTYIEPFNLSLTRETYTTPKFATSKPPLRLLHIADIHIERITPRERRLNRFIKDIKPDIIVFSGDFVNISCTYDEEAKEAIRKIIREWQAPLGVYCVPGTYTVEPVERVKTFVQGLDNLKLLLDQWVTVDAPAGKFHILGMVTRHILDIDQETFNRMMQQAPSDGVKLLLTHAPDVAPEADAAGIDLYMCGHTHGGQIRLPFIGALFSGSHLGMRFVMGRKDLERTTVYTSRGVGLEGLGAPRARFLCPPEIILWTIRGEA